MAKRPVKVTITYCAECGYESQTLALAGALMNEFTNNLSAVELIPWDEGSFDVSVDGQLVHSMYREGGFPEHETIAAAVRERLNAA
ncbi:MAG TPA: Rdx family protein [Thermomicrobiales bacterium]|nr:Rdx family protein [Thermomicrobiales bacterium]